MSILTISPKSWTLPSGRNFSLGRKGVEAEAIGTVPGSSVIPKAESSSPADASRLNLLDATQASVYLISPQLLNKHVTQRI
jgi:hypothetical protein